MNMRHASNSARLLALFARNKEHRHGFFALSSTDEAATVYLYDAVVPTSAEAEFMGGIAADAFVKAIRELPQTVRTINVRINSPGGDVFAARAMEAALRDANARVVVHIDGVAASAASVVAMAGDEINVSPGSFVMIHNAWTLALGNAEELLSTAALLEQVDDTLARTYAQRTGQDIEAIKLMMAEETWMNAERSVELGFADAITENDARVAAKASWNLSAYERAPQQASAEENERNATALAADTASHALARARLRARELSAA